MSVELLSGDQIAACLADLPHWTLSDDGKSISRKLVFEDFIEAFGFMTRAALVAEKHDHHPDWSNAFNVVSVMLTTDDFGGLTAVDIQVARALDQLL